MTDAQWTAEEKRGYDAGYSATMRAVPNQEDRESAGCEDYCSDGKICEECLFEAASREYPDKASDAFSDGWTAGAAKARTERAK